MVDGGSIWVTSCCSSLCLNAVLVWILFSSCRRRLRTSLNNSFRSTSEDSEPPRSSSRHTQTHAISNYLKTYVVCAQVYMCGSYLCGCVSSSWSVRAPGAPLGLIVEVVGCLPTAAFGDFAHIASFKHAHNYFTHGHKPSRLSALVNFTVCSVCVCVCLECRLQASNLSLYKNNVRYLYRLFCKCVRSSRSVSHSFLQCSSLAVRLDKVSLR